ncbi:ribosomal rRNA assembly protein [Angomonas deanei]|uniref:KRR1 small subunit processome component n=1 Tax=Angomonas deanei TaxID=59799 RepID=S9WGD7_9TRYP|nr:ribosomal rRNA assembly protein [Angomonas deanei]EPY38256.1 ribosomal rRNA assembly protein [Angomonas deanei]EPY39702.1 ribosomal rRNA assembly protein [Angomonas deanei]EPY42027.1 ribosomal rRNA assembly protein [Angomonas deanei]CAD2217960.1 Krr1 KH1 domain containing protein, putative [Angomonas deanei]|eukprot:EPY24767.1 ribosomal rRNA assembly protein [Angomonas deanei]
MSNSKYQVPDLTQDDVPSGACCVDETTFGTLFPNYLESYIREVWPAVEEILSQQHLVGKLDLLEGSMTVATTRRTWDPYAIVKARDFIKLLARNVPLAQAQKIFQTDIFCDIINIAMKGTSTRRFVKRRDRLVGPKAQTLKAIEILTGCYVLVQGKTVAAMGPVKGLQMVRKIVEDCMDNIHPIYNLKQMLIKRELSKREDMKHEDWSRFIPVYKKSLPNKEKRKAIAKVKKERLKATKAKEKTKEKSIFPPAPPKRLEDIAIESGEAFLSEKKRSRDDYELQTSGKSDKKVKPDRKTSKQ